MYTMVNLFVCCSLQLCCLQVNVAVFNKAARFFQLAFASASWNGVFGFIVVAIESCKKVQYTNNWIVFCKVPWSSRPQCAQDQFWSPRTDGSLTTLLLFQVNTYKMNINNIFIFAYKPILWNILKVKEMSNWWSAGWGWVVAPVLLVLLLLWEFWGKLAFAET